MTSNGEGRKEKIRERKQPKLTKVYSQKGALRIRETERWPRRSMQETQGDVKHEMSLGRWGRAACRVS